MKVEEELVCSCNKIIALHERILGEKRKSDRIYRTRCISVSTKTHGSITALHTQFALEARSRTKLETVCLHF